MFVCVTAGLVSRDDTAFLISSIFLSTNLSKAAMIELLISSDLFCKSARNSSWNASISVPNVAASSLNSSAF